jgi:hypothetical protein
MILVFGDSFAKIFTLFKENIVKVYSYKGGTLKGLTKINNENRLSIEKIIKKNKKIKYVIFSFGQVDLNLSFYYDVIKNNGHIPTDGGKYYAEYIKLYVEWIANLPGIFNRIIISPYISPLSSEMTIKSQVNYGSSTKEDIEKYKEELDFCADDLIRLTRYYEYLYQIEQQCNTYKNLIYFNLNKYILNENLVLKKEFYDVSPYNMHIRWGPIIPYIIEECINKNIPINNRDIVDNIQEIEDNYVKEKTERMIINKDYYI